MAVPRKVAPAFAVMTGIASIDTALSGGLPVGLTEVSGEPGVGKTALLGHVLASGQRMGKRALLLAAEYLDLEYLARVGVDLDELALVMSGTPDIEQTCLNFLSHGPDAVLAIDSMTSFRGGTVDGQGWNKFALGFLVQLRQHLRARSCVALSSQVRSKKSLVPGKMFMRDTETALRRQKDMCDTRLEVSRAVDEYDRYQAKVFVAAHTLGPPGAAVRVPVVKGFGADLPRDLVRTALRLGVLEKRGAYYYLGELRLGMGEDNATLTVAESPALQNRLLDTLVDG